MADTAVASAGAAVAVRAQPAVDQATAALLLQMDLRTERLVSRQAHESFAAETRQAREADRAAHAAFATEMRTELKNLRTELKDLRTDVNNLRSDVQKLVDAVSAKVTKV